MNVLKNPLQWLQKIGDQLIWRDEKERQQQRITAIILILLASVFLFYQAVT